MPVGGREGVIHVAHPLTHGRYLVDLGKEQCSTNSLDLGAKRGMRGNAACWVLGARVMQIAGKTKEREGGEAFDF